MGMVIKPRAPYAFSRVLERFSLNPLYKVDLDLEELALGVRLPSITAAKHVEDKLERTGKKVIVYMQNKGTVEDPGLSLTFSSGDEELFPAEIEWLLVYLGQRFQWYSEDLTHFYQAIQGDPVLGQLVHRLRGLPLIREEGIYEGLIKIIIQQQVNMAFAKQLIYSLAKEYGDSLMVDGYTYVFFPTPGQLAQVKVEDLRQRKFSQRKAEYIISLAQKIEKKELLLEELVQLDNQQIIDKLTAERGVGLWTVECLLLFCLGRPDLFPAGDLGIRKALQQVYGYNERPSAAVCREWAKPFQAWGSYLAIYLWEALKEEV